ncbi:MAG: PRC-barrel domain-containing protein [Candidatus Micrarchaeota archaeon]|nr:PRC-barrel domain-containing protein [Candidatus Micrarchaeota archaeon]MDE1849200.1 PRC-barrel domain-containing protein [Candidatus Micrarchaeota archaeon]
MAGVAISELYNKKVIASDGRVLGEVKGVIINIDDAAVSHLLLNNVENLIRSGNLRDDFLKNSIMFKRVKKISETIIVSEK